MIKDTELIYKHRQLGAKMAPFAGYNMPISYSGLIDEHLTVRDKVGVFDVSHMGEFIIKGQNALSLIQKVTSNDASKLFDGKVQYSCLPNKTGGIVDDLLVYKIKDEHYMLVVNASNIEKDWNWIKYNNFEDAQISNISNEISLLAVQGPLALKTLQKLTNVDLSKIPYYEFRVGTFDYVEDIIISNTGYTGAGGFELYIPNKDVEKLWDDIFEAGKEFGIKPIGLGARDTLRLEMGFCLYGNDINDSTSPLEAGLGWITKFSKDFINKDFLYNQKLNGVTRKLVAFEMIDRGIPRHDYKIINSEGIEIGIVTSGTQSPSLNKGIGMGYVSLEYSTLDTDIYIVIRESKIKAKVVSLPFYKNQNEYN